MYETLSSGAHLFRATALGTKWKKLLLGQGAYYTNGGRYNETHQPTVYAADDPTVAISELGYYQAREWLRVIGDRLNPAHLTFPLVSEHFLWCFALSKAIRILDLTDPGSRNLLPHYDFSLTLPSQDYGATRELANKIRCHPDPASPSVFGMRAPSVRTESHGNKPTQIVLFPGDKGIAATLIEQRSLTVEFLDEAGQQVNAKTKVIDWSRPRFQIHGGKSIAPLSTIFLGSGQIVRSAWTRLPIRHV